MTQKKPNAAKERKPGILRRNPIELQFEITPKAFQE